MTRVFLAPRSNETAYKSFLSTIENGVDFSVVAPHLNADGLKRLSGRDKLFVWGNKETVRPSFEKMQLGDLVLFYRGRKGKERAGRIAYAGFVSHTQISRALSLALWPPKPEQEPWACVFFLDALEPVNIPIADIADFAGYSRNFVVQGFMPLREEGVAAILKAFGSLDSFLRHYSGERRELDPDLESVPAVTAHSEAAMLLLKIGRLLGYDTYSPDAGRKAFGELLRSYCTLDQVPKRFLGDLTNVIQEIDVLWFQDDVPRYAFEVEHTTKVGSGLQRLYQLNPLGTKLFVVASEKTRRLFDKFIETDPYFRCRDAFHFRNYRQLEGFFRAVSEFDAVNRAFLDGQ